MELALQSNLADQSKEQPFRQLYYDQLAKNTYFAYTEGKNTYVREKFVYLREDDKRFKIFG